MKIHVTIPDADTTLAVVSTLLNQGFKVTIDLDEMTEVVIDPPTKVLRKPNAHTRNRMRRERADRQAMYDVRYAQANAARAVECPSCDAPIDHPCTTSAGKPYGAFVHTNRFRAMQTAQAQ